METKKLHFVHFVIDDKFIHDSIRCFQMANLTENNFYCISRKIKGHNYLDKEEVEFIPPVSLNAFIENLKVDDVVVLHSLYAMPADFICKIPHVVKIIWYGWGFDLYSNDYPIKPLIPFENGRLLPRTKEKIGPFLFMNKIFKRLKFQSKINNFKSNSADIIYRAISRIDFFAGVFPSEYDLLKKHCPYFHAKQLTHNYIHPEEFDIKDIDNIKKINGHNILLGNSAAYLCNHLDIMYTLFNKTTIRDYNIYCPLSYDGNMFYIKMVIKEGKKLFGDRFKPMLNYLPFDEYTKIIQSCNSVILGYEQQSATCTCLTSLWNGLKVFVPKDSMNYNEYRNQEGLEIYSIEDDLDDSTISMCMSNCLIEQRKKISSIYSYNRWQEDLQDAINILRAEI